MSAPHGHSHGPAPSLSTTPVGLTDQMINLQPFIDDSSSQVLNADPTTNLKSIIGLNSGILRSDVDIDPELIVVLNFREAVRVRGIKFQATESKSEDDTNDASGPATVKVFLHKPHYSFSECESEEATETIQLTKKQLESGEEVRIKYVKFQNVTSLTLFIQKNQDDSRQQNNTNETNKTISRQIPSATQPERSSPI